MKKLIDWIGKQPAIGILSFCTVTCFMLLAASSVSAATFKSVNGEVVIEAESFTRLAGSTGGRWSVNNQTSGYLGSGYIQATTNDPRTLTYSSSTMRAEYDINFQETGTYYLHLRTYATDHSNNGFFATLDGRNFYYGHPNAYYITVPWNSQWWWYSDGGGAEARGYRVSINVTRTGVQTLAIVRRDKGTRLDRIWLTKHQSSGRQTSSISLPSPSQFLSTASSPPASSPPPDPVAPTPPDTVDSGQIVISARSHAANVSRGDHGWVSVNHNGVQAMEAVPDSGARIASNYTTSSPYMRFNVNFQRTGTYYIWLRGFCMGNDNSAHVGLNGQAVAAGANITLPVNRAWVWSGNTGAGQRATVSVSSTGTQTIEVYMREDGLILDRILLTTSSSYTPSGAPESNTGGTTAPATGSAFQQEGSANGLAVMNARNSSANVSRGSHGWAAISHNGVQAMEAIPDSGARIASNYVSNSPYLRFNVNFQRTGTHYIWLRGFCMGNDNSAHVGLNGQAAASGANITLPVNSEWVWSGNTGAGQRATVSVSSTGVQTIEVYMREDGFILDKVVITTSAGYIPSGAGPAESVRR